MIVAAVDVATVVHRTSVRRRGLRHACRMRWEDVARAQGGVVDLSQLRSHGLSEAEIDGLISRRDLVEVHPSVYRQRGTPDTELGAAFAAALWCGGYVGYRTAASIWLIPVAAGPNVDVLVPDLRFRGRATGVRVHRVQLPRHDVIVHDGLPITTRVRTITDLLGVLGLPEGRDLAGRSMRSGWLALSDLDRRLVEGRGRAGNVRIRKLRAEADPNSQAEFERQFVTLLRSAAVTGWEQQHPVRLPSGQVIRADIAFPERRLIIELDGWAWHNTGARFRQDRKRWRGAVAVGWRVVQFTWDDLDRPAALLREILQLLAA